MNTFTTYALGFPIVLVNPKVKVMAGQETLDINYEVLARIAFPAILQKKGRLTGGEIKFIRNYLGLNQTEFAKEMGLADHSPVSRWENNRDMVTKMDLHTEFAIRIKAMRLAKLRVTNPILDIFDALKEVSEAGDIIELDADKVA